MSLVELKGISKSYTRGSRQFFALDDVSFNLNDGDFINIIGKSGSGKTTLLTVLAAINRPDKGELIFDGKKIFDLSDDEKSVYRNETIGYVPQSLGTIPTLNVLDNVRLPYFFEKRNGDGAEKAEKLLKQFGIYDLKDDFCKNLSGGELKRVLIARALINDAKLIIADEPTSDLDTKTTFEIMDVLNEINKNGTSIIIVTHDNELLKYGNRLLEMKDGKLSEVPHEKIK